MGLADRFESCFIFVSLLTRIPAGVGGCGEVNLSMFTGANKYPEIYFSFRSFKNCMTVF